MSVLVAELLCKSYGSRSVLTDVGIVLQPGERVGLLGSNGCGKSTLAKILAGVEAPDSGSVVVKKGARVSYFAQEPDLNPNLSIKEIVAEGLGDWRKAYERYEKISTELVEGSDNEEMLLAEQAEAMTSIERLGGWERMHLVDSTLDRLGVTRRDALVAELSGGEQRRVALARLLVSQPDLAIVDEPTNHLDIQAIEWLEEQFVTNYSGALLFITHDRYMLDSVAQRIVEIDDSQVFSYRGGWEAYLEAKAERAALAERTEANRKNFLRTELEWLSRSPQARTTKQKARIQRAESVRDRDRPTPAAAPSLLSVQVARAGRTVLDIRDLRLQLGDLLLIEKLDLCLAKGDRIGVIGRNGVGKTSLLRAILGQLEPVSGSIALGATMKVGYFEQARASLDLDASIFDNVIGDRSDVVVGPDVISPYAYLGRFLFSRKRVRDKLGLLSGGERARVALAKMLIDPVNLLLLDEPTNDLDVGTLSALEDMLISTAATAIVVTHDRYFLDRIATGVLAFEGGGRVTPYASTAQARSGAKLICATPKSSEPKNSTMRVAKGNITQTQEKLTYAERIELTNIFATISQHEKHVAQVEHELAAPDLYKERGNEVPELVSRLKKAKETLDHTIGRWEYLESKS